MTLASVAVSGEGTTADISITGEVDLSNAESVQEQLFSAISNRLTSVRLDLGGLGYIDSAGMRILFALAERLRLLQTDCTVFVPKDSPTRRVLELSGLDSVLTLEG